MGRIGQVLNSATGLAGILTLLTLLAAFIFNKIEAPAETHTRIIASKARQRIFVLAQELADQGDDADWSKLVTQVDKYRDKLLQAWKSGNDELGMETRPPSWSFWGSVYYLITVFTTIGYGNVAPSTNAGRLATIIFGLIAIPLCSMVISRLSQKISRLLKAIYLMTQDSSGIPVGLKEAYARAGNEFDFSLLPSFGLLVVYGALSGVVYCWAIGETAAEWTPLEALYFSFISITSIGLGDIVPNSDVFLSLASVAYVILGLAIMNLFFSRLIELADGQLEAWANPPPPPVSQSKIPGGGPVRFAMQAVGGRGISTSPSANSVQSAVANHN